MQERDGPRGGRIGQSVSRDHLLGWSSAHHPREASGHWKLAGLEVSAR